MDGTQLPEWFDVTNYPLPADRELAGRIIATTASPLNSDVRVSTIRYVASFSGYSNLLEIQSQGTLKMGDTISINANQFKYNDGTVLSGKLILEYNGSKWISRIE